MTQQNVKNIYILIGKHVFCTPFFSARAHRGENLRIPLERYFPVDVQNTFIILNRLKNK